MSGSPPVYRAPRWLPGGNLQTLYPALLAPVPAVAWHRERQDTPDGDFIDLDWTEPGGGDGRQPLLALFHGLEGSSNSHYARALMHAAMQRGWQGVVVHFRGCSGEINRLPRAYHSGDSAEIDWILRRLRESHAGPLFACGISLGGNALLKWLGEQGPAATGILQRAAGISAPLDLQAAATALERGFNLAYTGHFLATMKRKSLAKLRAHPGLFDAARLRAARTLREFDDLVTAPLHGFRGVDDYYDRSSSKPYLARIRVPTLLLNARNDPFLPSAALPAPHELAAEVTALFPDEGGHVGFPDPAGTLDWLPHTVLEFFTGE
ncbi:MAG: hydrolase [Burkholderiales bacterium]|nr:hydrolase [Burkholderiales bacterium]